MLRPGGKLVILDVVEPPEESLVSRALLGLAAAAGDLIRELGPLLSARGIDFVEQDVGGFGVVRLFIGRTPGGPR